MEAHSRRGVAATVAVVEMQPLLLAGIRTVLQQYPTIAVVDDPRTAAPGPVDVLVGGDRVARSREVWAELSRLANAYVVVAADLDYGRFVGLLRRDILCIVDGNGAADDLARAVHTARDGGSFIARRFAGLVRDMAHRAVPVPLPGTISLSGLTGRERQVLELVRRGLANQQIAEALNISIRTAKFHVSNILGKLGFRSRGRLIAVLGGALEVGAAAAARPGPSARAEGPGFR